MNLSDAGVVREILAQAGYEETTDETGADLALLVTCSVREHAEARAIGRLQNLRGRKRQNPELVLAVLGCMAQNRALELANGLGADLVVGPDDYRQLPELVRRFRDSRQRQIATRLGRECYEGIVPREESPVTGMISVMRGCNNYCAYCVVPYVRGAERSKGSAAILDEARALIARGVKDITLIGQNVLAYRDGDLDFVGLLRLVDELPESPRIRFLTSHPKDVSRELVQELGQLRNFCAHIHLPVQSGSNRILAAMNRRYTREEYLERVGWLRTALPDISITTDVLVGFPGESDEDFVETLNMVQSVQFDSAFMFRYSERPGTRACAMEPKVPDLAARARLAELIRVQNRITSRRSDELVGRRLEVLVERSRGADTLARARNNRIVVLKQAAPTGALLIVEIGCVSGWTPIGVPVESTN